MKLNNAGISLIKKWEGWRARAYKDAVGVWTIGYGHTSMAGAPKVVPGMVISRSEGELMLRKDLKKYEKAVQASVKVPLNDNQYSALVSFCYNVGPGNFRKSSVLRYVNAKNFSGVPRRLALWNKAKGRVLKGLTRRRAAEGRLFMKQHLSDAPLKKSRTAKGGLSAAGGGGVLLGKEAIDLFSEQQWALSSGNLIMFAVGAIIVAGGLYALYARWDDAGRPSFKEWF